MSKPKIGLTRRWPVVVEQELAARYEVLLNSEDTPLSADAIAQLLQNCDAICPTVTDDLNAEVLAVRPIRAQLIANYGVGYNHIDIAAASTAGLRVTNTPDVLTDATADLTLALMLNLVRRTAEGERELRANCWSGWRPTHLLGGDISGKRLGIIGFGRIGRAVARRAHFGFGMSIVFHTPSPPEMGVAEEFNAERCDSVEALLAASDIVSLHCPGGAERSGMMNAARLSCMKPNSYLINTARGDLIDEAALVDALEHGPLAGAGLDVYAQEPAIPAKLMARDDVVLLPHLGSATRNTRIAMGRRALRNLDAHFAGERLPDLIELS
ncbi:MAG: D-glycerate dehydrogenase [Pseudomonadota bacterium]